MSDLIDNVLDFARGRLGGGITLSRDANRPLEPVLEQVVDEPRTASPRRVIETLSRLRSPSTATARGSAAARPGRNRRR
jgi:phosphoserine phosphatase RsbU/P